MSKTKRINESVTAWEIWKRYPRAKEIWTFDLNGWSIKGVFVHAKCEYYEIITYTHEDEETGEKWDEIVIACYYDTTKNIY